IQPRNFAANTPHSSQQPFDSEKIVRRIFLCQNGKKRTVAATEIDFERRKARKNFVELKYAGKRFRHIFDARLVCVQFSSTPHVIKWRSFQSGGVRIDHNRSPLRFDSRSLLREDTVPD